MSLSLIPGWVKWAVIAALLALLGVQEIRINNANSRMDKHLRVDAENALKAVREADAVYDYWDTINRKKDEDYGVAKNLFDQSIATLAADRDDLRGTLQRFAKRNSTCPGAPPGSPPVDRGDPIGVLALVLERVDADAEVFARTADARKLTASACEARYDTLTKQSP